MEENVNSKETTQITENGGAKNSINFKVNKYPILTSFIDKMVRISDLFNNSDVRHLYFDHMVSIKNLSNKEECEQALELLNFIKKYIDLIDFSNNEIKDEVNKKVTKALREIKKCIKKF